MINLIQSGSEITDFLMSSPKLIISLFLHTKFIRNSLVVPTEGCM